VKISSTMPGVQLANVMSISKSFGGTQYSLNLQVLGFWTVPTDGQPDKKSVIFLTQAGPYWLNGTEVAEAGPGVLNGLFGQAKTAASQGPFPSFCSPFLFSLALVRFNASTVPKHTRH
jgi:hypothetical protein